MKLAFKVEHFEGPLDLLLNLITKDEIDIYDIPMVHITDQYMAYLSIMPVMDLDMTSEFLVMAATLLEIKSKMLLPDKGDTLEEYMVYSYDPREELVTRLLEYKRFKEAASMLRDKEGVLDDVVFKPQEELSAFTKTLSIEELNANLEKELLSEAVQRLLLRNDRFDNKKSQFFKRIKRDLFTVEDKIIYVQSQLKDSDQLFFSHLFGEIVTKEEVVVTFLALLELLKMKVITIKQEMLFDEILIEKRLVFEDEQL